MCSLISEILGDIPQPDIPDIELHDVPGSFIADNKDLFASRKKWHAVNNVAPRCDFAPSRALIKPKKYFFVHCLWRRSVKGPTLSEIKASDEFVPMFANQTSAFIAKCLGSFLGSGDWAVITPPPRRHKIKNFAQSVAALIAQNLNIKFYHDVLRARNRQRINAVYDVANIPENNNLIVYDDIVTTGSTMIATYKALNNFNKNLIFFASISNE